jgi:acyl-CoA synthetase (AMP-forming)/AMP-acid ligase II
MSAEPGATTITTALDYVLEADPQRLALVGPSRSLSYAELDAAANAAAAAFREMGVAPGDRVAASLPNDVDIVVAFHGAMRLGAVWVGVNRALAATEKEGLLDAATPAVFLADPRTAGAHEARWRVVRVDPSDPRSDWSSALAATADASRLAAPDPDDPAAIAFTSGTTGLPKGIIHSQRNLLLPAASLAVSRHYDTTLRKGDCLPLTILNLQVLTTLLTSAAGGCCVLTDRRDARGVAEWLATQAVTVWNGVPALIYSMVHDPDLDPRLFGSLQEVWTGGAACPGDLFEAFRSRFGVPLRQSYGLTEAPTVVTIEPAGSGHVDESSGVALPHLDVAICDDDGNELPAGQVGEIVVRAARRGPWAGEYTPMLGYWQDATVERFEGRDLRTGDLGLLDDAGNLLVRERKKLVIIRGGANVYPAEIERVLERVPGVRASAVIGIPDPRLGQRVVAAIEPDPGSAVSSDDVLQRCRGELARYKVPERIVVVETLPRNAMGKVQREPLAALFA